jgi:hypothetical protein
MRKYKMKLKCTLTEERKHHAGEEQINDFLKENF